MDMGKKWGVLSSILSSSSQIPFSNEYHGQQFMGSYKNLTMVVFGSQGILIARY